jgi:hypothetical protein
MIKLVRPCHLFIEVPVPHQKSVPSCIYVLRVSNSPLSTIFLVSVSSIFTWIPVFRRKHALLLQARYNNNFESFTRSRCFLTHDLSKERKKEQNDKQWSTKFYTKTTNWTTRIPLKRGMNSDALEGWVFLVSLMVSVVLLLLTCRW